MTLPQTYLLNLLVMIAGALLLGSWASAYQTAGKWRFELFYVDFALGAMLAILIYAFTAGDLGFDGFSIMDDLSHARKRQLLFGFLGGVVFNLGNLFLVAAISVGGMSLAFPVSLGLTVLVGVVVGPALRQSANPAWLAAGCVAIAVSVVLNVQAHQAMVRRRYAAAGPAGKRRGAPSGLKGPALAAVSGLLLSGAMPLVDNARAEETGLGPYALLLMMGVGMLVSSFVYILFFMNLPVEGEPLEVADLLKTRPKVHLLGVLAGILWATGALANLLPQAQNLPQEAHLSAALVFGLTQASAIVAALWGLAVWHDLRDGNGGAKGRGAAMLLLYAGGVAAISVALEIGKKG